MTPEAALDRGLVELSMPLSREEKGRLLAYLELLVKWNRTYNLTAIRDPVQMVNRHVLDSLAVVPHLPVPAESPALADVGSGAGLPGIPIALVRPSWRVVLNDSSEKKAAFLRQAVIELGLGNVAIAQERVQSWRPAKPFPLVVSRAFSDFRRFVSACRHLVQPGGVLAAMKAAAKTDELEATQSMCRSLEVVALPAPWAEARHLVLCRV